MTDTLLILNAGSSRSLCFAIATRPNCSCAVSWPVCNRSRDLPSTICRGKLWMSKPGLPVLVCLISRRLSFYLTGGNVIAAVRFIWSRPVIA
jgi:hypothetical protein